MSHEIAVYIPIQESMITLLSLHTLVQLQSKAVITHRIQGQQSLSNCSIASLEVYRGGLNTPEISHKGFSINSQNSIIVS